jgi:hypothetical protein
MGRRHSRLAAAVAYLETLEDMPGGVEIWEASSPPQVRKRVP